jgi:hypothetical protein
MKSEIFKVQKSNAAELFCRRPPPDSNDWKHHLLSRIGSGIYPMCGPDVD